MLQHSGAIIVADKEFNIKVKREITSFFFVNS